MKRNYLIMIMLGAFLMSPNDASAQFLKKLGQAVKKSVEQSLGINNAKTQGSESQQQTVKKGKYVIKADTTTAEGMFDVGADMLSLSTHRHRNNSYRDEQVQGWTEEEFEELEQHGNRLIIQSAENGYLPAQKVIYKSVIFNNSKETTSIDPIAISYMEKAAEGNDSDAIVAMLYLMWNYCVGNNGKINMFMNPGDITARYVGPVDLKKSRYYLEKILANEKATDRFYDDGAYLSDNGMERKGAEWCLNELNKKIGDRASKDLTNGLAKKIVGRWKMSIYDGITSVYTFNSNGTFTAHHTYKAPAVKQGWIAQFDTSGNWGIEGTDAVAMTTKKRLLNDKMTYSGNNPEFVRAYRKIQADAGFASNTLYEMVRNCDGGLDYLGTVYAPNYIKVSEINNTTIKGRFIQYHQISGKNAQLVKVK